MPLQMVVLDAYGVIYDEHGIVEPLLHFVREEGCLLTEAENLAAIRRSNARACSSPEFWERIGLNGPADELFERNCGFYSLMPGLLDFLASMQALGLRVACLSNDGADFSLVHRQRYALESLISPWIISGEVGLVKPEPAIFELLLSRTRLSAEECLLVDDRTVMLDAAHTLGFRTALFRPASDGKGGAESTNGHAFVTSFAELELVWLRVDST